MSLVRKVLDGTPAPGRYRLIIQAISSLTALTEKLEPKNNFLLQFYIQIEDSEEFKIFAPHCFLIFYR